MRKISNSCTWFIKNHLIWRPGNAKRVSAVIATHPMRTVRDGAFHVERRTPFHGAAIAQQWMIHDAGGFVCWVARDAANAMWRVFLLQKSGGCSYIGLRAYPGRHDSVPAHGVCDAKTTRRNAMQEFHATTICAVRRDGMVAMGGDGQVTLGNQVAKQTARKVRLLAGGQVLVGFAGSAADAFALMERFEKRLEEFNRSLLRAATELAKEWRTDRALRRLESMMIASDRDMTLLLGGSGDIIEPDHGVVAIGSGGGFAQAAAQALIENTALDAATIVRKSLEIAGQLCIYTNTNITVQTL